MQRLKQYINSPKGMNLINIIFWLAIFLSYDVVQLIAYGCWSIWLVFCIRRTSSRVVKVVYSLFLVFAVVMVIGGAYSIISYEEEPTRVYAFRGENEKFSISNGVIVVAEEGDVFYGGTLKTKGEYLSDISSYSVSFYLDMGSEVHTLMSNRLVDMTGTPIQLPDDLGKISGDGMINHREIEQLGNQLYCELQTKDLEGNSEVQKLQMEVVQITK